MNEKQLRKFSTKMRPIDLTTEGIGRGAALAVLLTVLLPTTADACTRCFGMGVDNATTHGISMAMFGLLVMLGIVWGGIGAFFYRMKKRSDLREAGTWMVTEQGRIERQGD